MATMLAPVPNRSFVATSTQVYQSDGNGIIVGVVAGQDVTDLQAQGCFLIDPPPTELLFKLIGANFNSGGAGATGDQLMTPVFSYLKYKFRIRRITVDNTSVNGMSTAAGGVYTAAGKTGSIIVAAGQLYTNLTNALTALDLTMNLPNLVNAAGTPLYFSLTTPQGATATADVRAYGDVLTT